jgi:hypothetical protein
MRAFILLGISVQFLDDQRSRFIGRDRIPEEEICLELKLIMKIGF